MNCNHDRRDFLRYAMVGGIAVPLSFAPGLLIGAQANVFNFAQDPENLTDMER
jgi:hypothetical protein